jgi:membrane protease YdiL (CAAX protease family)
MSHKDWWLSRTGVVTTATALTLIVLAESLFFPWSPYFIIYAILAITIPIALKTYRFGHFRTVMASTWPLTLVVLVLAVIWDSGLCGWLYEQILFNLGASPASFYSINAATNLLTKTISQDMGISIDTAQMLFAFFVLIWAPIGEELFYRGYVFGSLRNTHGFWTASLISALFFGVRHATHMFYLWPDVPWGAAVAWPLCTFVFGNMANYLYEKTHSLYPIILVHFLVNIIGIAITL